MSRKTLYISLLILLVVLGLFGWYFLSRTPATQAPAGTETGDSDLFPFGSSTPGSGSQTGTVKPGGSTSGSGTIDLSGGSAVVEPRLRKVSDDQVSGAGIFEKGGITIIHYMDRATGHIFETNADTMARNKISNITMPQIYETLWSLDGSELIARYLKDDDTIQSFYGRLPATTTSSSVVEGYFLPANIREISAFSDKIIYLDPAQDGVLVSSDMDGTKKAFVSNTYSEDWLLGLVSAKNALIGAKPSGLVAGDLYTLDMATGNKLKVMKDVLGLSGLMSPDGSVIIASAAQRNGIASAVYTTKDRKLSTLSLSTLSDKCVWSETEKNIAYCAVPTAVPAGVYPDDWYQGFTSFDDRLWRIDASDDETDLILDPSIEAGEDMDMTHLDLDASGSHIIFINKKDSSLWVLDLK